MRAALVLLCGAAAAALCVCARAGSDSTGGGFYDEHGCCSSCGQFWCGSSGRCLGDEDECEEGAGAVEKQCVLTSSLMTLDLTPLLLTTETDYSVSLVSSLGANGGATTGQKVVTNVCANSATPMDICAATTGAAGEVLDDPAPAYLITTGSDDGQDDSCQRLGASLNEEENFEVGYLDDSHKALGVYVQYLHGNTCSEKVKDYTSCDAYDSSDDGSKKKSNKQHCSYTLRINFHCSANETTLPASVMPRFDPSPCDLVLDVPSMYACPTECPVTSRGICNQAGVCMVDSSTSTLRCFCDDDDADKSCVGGTHKSTNDDNDDPTADNVGSGDDDAEAALRPMPSDSSSEQSQETTHQRTTSTLAMAFIGMLMGLVCCVAIGSTLLREPSHHWRSKKYAYDTATHRPDDMTGLTGAEGGSNGTYDDDEEEDEEDSFQFELMRYRVAQHNGTAGDSDDSAGSGGSPHSDYDDDGSDEYEDAEEIYYGKRSEGGGDVEAARQAEHASAHARMATVADSGQLVYGGRHARRGGGNKKKSGRGSRRGRGPGRPVSAKTPTQSLTGLQRFPRDRNDPL